MIDILLAAFGMNFLQYGKFFLVAVFILVIFKRGGVRFTTDFWVLMLFAMSFFVIDWVQNHSMEMAELLCPVAFLLGVNLEEAEHEKGIYKTIMLLSLAMASHSLLNFFYETVRKGGLNYSALHYDVWTRKVSSVTGQMTNYVPILGYSGCTIFYFRKYSWLFLLLIISTVHAVLSGSRTYIVFLGLGILLSVMIYLMGLKTKRAQRFILLFASLGVIVLTAWLFYSNNWFRVRTFWENSYLYQRLFSDYAVENNKGLFTTGRWSTKLRYIQMLPQYPLGGNHILTATGWYAHDILLDTADRAGIVPAVLILVYLTRMTGRWIGTAFRRNIDLEHRIIILVCLAIVLLELSMEPILSSVPTLMHVICVIDGMFAVYLKAHSGEEEVLTGEKVYG